jgi:hypothetical protein
MADFVDIYGTRDPWTVHHANGSACEAKGHLARAEQFYRQAELYARLSGDGQRSELAERCIERVRRGRLPGS